MLEKKTHTQRTKTGQGQAEDGNLCAPMTVARPACPYAAQRSDRNNPKATGSLPGIRPRNRDTLEAKNRPSGKGG